jgi:hypothetical protein
MYREFILSNKFWEELISWLPVNTYCIFDTTRIAKKTPRSTALLVLHVYPLPQERGYRAIG